MPAPIFWASNAVAEGGLWVLQYSIFLGPYPLDEGALALWALQDPNFGLKGRWRRGSFGNIRFFGAHIRWLNGPWPFGPCKILILGPGADGGEGPSGRFDTMTYIRTYTIWPICPLLARVTLRLTARRVDVRSSACVREGSPCGKRKAERKSAG